MSRQPPPLPPERPPARRAAPGAREPMPVWLKATLAILVLIAALPILLIAACFGMLGR